MHVHVLNVFKNHWFIVGQLTSVILYWSTRKLYCHLREILQYCTGYHRMIIHNIFHYSDCAIKEESKAAQDDEAAKKLWEVSEKMVGLQKWMNCEQRP